MLVAYYFTPSCWTSSGSRIATLNWDSCGQHIASGIFLLRSPVGAGPTTSANIFERQWVAVMREPGMTGCASMRQVAYLDFFVADL